MGVSTDGPDYRVDYRVDYGAADADADGAADGDGHPYAIAAAFSLWAYVLIVAGTKLMLGVPL